MVDQNCSYVSGATLPVAVDFLEVIERSARVADQTQRRLDEFFARTKAAAREIDDEHVKSLEQEEEQRWKRIAGLEAELALAWGELDKTYAALAEARHQLEN